VRSSGCQKSAHLASGGRLESHCGHKLNLSRVSSLCLLCLVALSDIMMTVDGLERGCRMGGGGRWRRLTREERRGKGGLWMRRAAAQAREAAGRVGGGSLDTDGAHKPNRW